MTTLPAVTLLITHYNRTASLERLLNSFKNRQTECSEIVVFDDGSLPENLEILHQLKKQFNFTLLTAFKNKGLGHNINKREKAATTAYNSKFGTKTLQKILNIGEDEMCVATDSS